MRGRLPLLFPVDTKTSSILLRRHHATHPVASQSASSGLVPVAVAGRQNPQRKSQNGATAASFTSPLLLSRKYIPISSAVVGNAGCAAAATVPRQRGSFTAAATAAAHHSGRARLYNFQHALPPYQKKGYSSAPQVASSSTKAASRSDAPPFVGSASSDVSTTTAEATTSLHLGLQSCGAACEGPHPSSAVGATNMFDDRGSSNAAVGPVESGAVDVASSGAFAGEAREAEIETIPAKDPLVNPSFSSQKIPKNYVKETLIPHLESQITVMAKGLDEQQLTNLTVAYAKLPKELRHKELETELADKIHFRLNGFSPQQIVQVLFPLYNLVGPTKLHLWRDFSEKIEKDYVLRELTVLNLIAVLRVFEKVADAHRSGHDSDPNLSASPSFSTLYFTPSPAASLAAADSSSQGASVSFHENASPTNAAALPTTVSKPASSPPSTAENATDRAAAAAVVGAGEIREGDGEFDGFLRLLRGLLYTGLTAFDAQEFHDVVVSLSQHHRQTRRDMQLLQLLLPLLDDVRISELSLLHKLSLLRALVKMKVLHQLLLDSVTAELQHSQRIRRMPAKVVAQVLWTFARVGRLSDIACSMGPLVEQQLPHFSPSDLARLAQALPPHSSVPLRVCLNLQPRLPSMSVQDFCFFFYACIRLNLLPDSDGAIPYLKFPPNSDGSASDPASAAAALVLSIDSKKLLNDLLEYIHRRENEFKREHIRRVVASIEGYREDYEYLLDKLPSDWRDIGTSLDMMCDRTADPVDSNHKVASI